MKLLEVNRQPGSRQLKQFGVVCLFALPLIGWVWGASWTAVALLAGIGAVVAVTGLVHPPALKPLFVGLSLVTLPIGWVLGELSLLLIYFGLFTPLALLFRLSGRDALRLKPDRAAPSAWLRRRRPGGVASYFRQS